ncbi:MAG: hypothetical protein LBI45_07315 [Bacteroidales bacterium]|jgi:hypothetical protein|nr:hypothetical protein [Bacteroidales bacterium]
MQTNLIPGSFKLADNSKYIAFENDCSFWRAILSGYKSLFRAGFARLLDAGLDEEEADAAQMLYVFMEDLEKELSAL